MLAKDAKAEFEGLLRARRTSLSSLSPRQAFDCMTSFFRDARVQDCDAEMDCDMLLLQWGTYDWGRGARFEFDVTRQMIPSGGDDDDVWQLHLTVRFEPDDDLRSLGAGNRWCHSVDQLEAFVDFVVGSEPFLSVADRAGGKVALDYELAG
jgi:hypothetical protein